MRFRHFHLLVGRWPHYSELSPDFCDGDNMFIRGQCWYGLTRVSHFVSSWYFELLMLDILILMSVWMSRCTIHYFKMFWCEGRFLNTTMICAVSSPEIFYCHLGNINPIRYSCLQRKLFCIFVFKVCSSSSEICRILIVCRSSNVIHPTVCYFALIWGKGS